VCTRRLKKKTVLTQRHREIRFHFVRNHINLSGAVSSPTLRTAYYLEYCFIIWGHTSSSVRLFRLQKKVIRIMANIGFREDCKLSFNSLKILTFPSLYIYKCLECIIKNINVYNPLNFHHNYDTRGNDICVNVLLDWKIPK
jgi:hypothetical protein